MTSTFDALDLLIRSLVLDRVALIALLAVIAAGTSYVFLRDEHQQSAMVMRQVMLIGMVIVGAGRLLTDRKIIQGPPQSAPAEKGRGSSRSSERPTPLMLAKIKPRIE